MGLTILYNLRAGDSEAKARKLTDLLHQAAQDLPIASVNTPLFDLLDHLPLNWFLALSSTATWRRQQRRGVTEQEAFRALFGSPAENTDQT